MIPLPRGDRKYGREVDHRGMMLSFFPWVVTSTTGPDSISVKALLNFNSRMKSPRTELAFCFDRRVLFEIDIPILIANARLNSILS